MLWEQYGCLDNYVTLIVVDFCGVTIFLCEDLILFYFFSLRVHFVQEA